MGKHWTNYSQLKKSCLAYIPWAHQHFPNDWNSSVQFSVELNEQIFLQYPSIAHSSGSGFYCGWTCTMGINYIWVQLLWFANPTSMTIEGWFICTKTSSIEACDSHIFKNNNVCDDVNVLYNKGSVKSSQLKKLSNWPPVHNLTWKWLLWKWG